MTFTDQLNRQINIQETPKRIVSLVPSQTELLIDLGLGDSIFGVTKFCTHPKELKQQKTIVGGTKTIKIDKIKDLKPDIILCNKEENSFEIVESLKKIAPIHISDIYNLNDAFELFEMYGDIFKVKEKANLIISEIKKEREYFQNKIQSLPKRKAAYFIWKNPWMVAASNTFVDVMLSEAGFKNIFTTETRYPEVSLDHSKLKEVEVIMLSSEPFPFKEKHIKELKHSFPKKEIILVDGEMFSWYGSRLKYVYQYFEILSL
ncbi:ABC transporter substrate-binding protein [Winogradskyella haliclonae]|uniref:Iron ABC transporter n=1 Tax=Winogradskyella haliclonae TaxID=2048558 RepID=A0ABQ2C0A9_9FLAO|nr:helical backbone metal receptor [Winogradskyella haliclonae]GGI58165.1 iron ABC transporter [Winogradskyella haliclonae]